MTIQRTYSGAPWENEVGYCRAIRVGDQIYVTGTAPISPDMLIEIEADAVVRTSAG